MKRLLSMVMMLSLLLSLCLVAQAADSAQAYTLRLESIQGSVSLTSGTQKALTCREGMKLLSGYSLSTKAASYAYISLDENKAVKLDGLSKATVKKSGKKLELLLSSGKLFFNVKSPLKQDESMDIRTSSMVTGIRGTSGFVEVLSPSESILVLLSGHVQTASYDPGTGKTTSLLITPGQLARFSQNVDSSLPEVRLLPLQQSDVPGFISAEIAKDSTLQTQIKTQTALDVDALIAQAPDRLKEDEAAQRKREQLAELALSAQTGQQTIPLFSVQTGGGGGGGGGTSVPAPVPSETTLYQVTDVSQIVAAWNTYDTVKLASNFELNASLNVPTGKTLELLPSYSLKTSQGATTNALSMDGTVLVDSGAKLINSVSQGPGIVVNSINSLKLDGELENSGILTVGSKTQDNADLPGALRISASGKLTNLTGTISLISGLLENKGTIDNRASMEILSGTFQNSGTFEILAGALTKVSGGQMNNSGSLTLSGTLDGKENLNNTAAGSIHVMSEGSLSNSKSLLSGLTMQNAGALTLDTGASFTSSANFVNTGSIANSGTLSYVDGFFLSTTELPSGPAAALTYQDNTYDSAILYADTFAHLLSNVPGASNAVLTLRNNLALSEDTTLPAGKTITLHTGIHTITFTNAQLNIASGANLTLVGDGTDNNLIDANPSNPILSNSGTLTLRKLRITSTDTGTVVTNLGSMVLAADTQISGAAVAPSVQNSGSLTVQENARVLNTNTEGSALSSGAGSVQLKDSASIETSSSTTTALLLSGGTMEMQGGSISSGNVGASVSGSAVLTLSGGTISAPNCAIQLKNTSGLTMTGGNIIATLSSGGQGVFVSNGATFTLNGATAMVQTESSSKLNCAVHNEAASGFFYTAGVVRAKGSEAVYQVAPTDAVGILPDGSWFQMKK